MDLSNYLLMKHELSLIVVFLLLICYDLFASDNAKKYYFPVACGIFLIHTVFCFFINAHYTKKELDYGVLQQSIDFLPTLIMSASMGVFVIIVGFLFKNDPTINLPIQILSGVVFFIVGCHLFKIKSYANAICLFKQKG